MRARSRSSRRCRTRAVPTPTRSRSSSRVPRLLEASKSRGGCSADPLARRRRAPRTARPRQLGVLGANAIRYARARNGARACGHAGEDEADDAAALATEGLEQLEHALVTSARLTGEG